MYMDGNGRWTLRFALDKVTGSLQILDFMLWLMYSKHVILVKHLHVHPVLTGSRCTRQVYL